MSIFTGKNGYNSNESWTERSDVERLKAVGQYDYETSLGDGIDPVTAWLRDKIIQLPLRAVYPDGQCQPDILEVGSGFGGWSEKLKGLYHSFTGAEVMEERVNHARKIRTLPNVEFHHVKHPFDLGRKFDVVLSITVIQHLAIPEAINCLQAISRHLRDDGVAFMSEGRIMDCSVAAAEAVYAQAGNAAHMIPKPLHLLQEAVPDLKWEREGNLRFTLRKK